LFEVFFDPFNYPFWILISLILTGAIIAVSRPFSTYIKFAYINALFEAMGNPFIEEKELSRLIDSKNISDFKDTLNAYKYYKITGENPDEIQQSLDENLMNSIKSYRKDSSKNMNDFFDAYIERFDIYLIKNEIKKKLKNEEINKKSIDRCMLPKTKKLLDDLSNMEGEKILDIVKSYGFGKEVVNVLFKDDKDFLDLDIAIDRHIFDIIKKAKVPHNCQKGKQNFIKTYIDINNIKNILRAKHLSFDEETCKRLFLGEGLEIALWKFEEIIQLEQVSQIITNLEGTSYFDILKDSIEDYNKEESIQVFENSLDSLFLKLLRNISLNNYVNIGPTIRFIVSKEFEIKNLKIITKGIGEKLPSNEIEKLLIKEAS
jgi:vacuolar-type H+-ATPase subunit C/Vma6